MEHSIKDPYLLVIDIPCYGRGASRAVSSLWHRDLVEHLRYIRRFTLAAPCARGGLPSDALSLDNAELGGTLRHVDLPHSQSFLRAVLNLPLTVLRLWQAVGNAKIVHTGVAGWPLPLGWLAAPIARIRKRFLVIIVESAPWRLLPGQAYGMRKRLRAFVNEWLARWCVGLADVSFFTQSGYLASLLRKGQERGHVIHASWIHDDVILSDQQAENVWKRKLGLPTEPLHLVFAGRLTTGKGISTLLDAAKILSRLRVQVMLEILGSGDYLAECARQSRQLEGSVSIRVKGELPYNRSFFRFLRTAHAVLVPSVSDEQPRIVYDAFSQALPVLASTTAGLRDCVHHGQNGMLVPACDPKALAEVIEWASCHRDALRRMGLCSLQCARRLTHREMHRKRREIILRALSFDARC